MANYGDGYSKAAASDADLLHGCGQTGKVLHSGSRHEDITSSTAKGMDPGMAATLGRPKSTSDYKSPTPEDLVVAPGQRTVLSPKGETGNMTPTKMY